MNLRMEEGQIMQEHLTRIEDIREQLINVDKVISNLELVKVIYWINCVLFIFPS